MGNAFADAVASGPLVFGVLAAALAGLVSFASPCVVPLVPGYLSYLAGIVGGKTPGGKSKRAGVVGASLLFILGFSVVFVLATVTVFGAISLLTLNHDILMRIGGIITIVMGAVFLGWIPGLQRDTRLAPKRIASWIGAPLLGGVFALGWTPCLGPTLASIISVAAGTQGMTAVRGVILIAGYCLGLGLPFVLLAWGSNAAVRGVDFLRKHTRTIQIIGGVCMILVGVALLTGLWDVFITWVRQWTFEYGATLI